MKKIITWAGVCALLLVPISTFASDVNVGPISETSTAVRQLTLDTEQYRIYQASEVNTRKNDKGGIDVESKPVGRIRDFCIEVYGDGTYAIDLYDATGKKYQTFNVEADGSFELNLYADGKMVYSAKDGVVENTTKYTPEHIIDYKVADAIGQDLQYFLGEAGFYPVAKITDYLDVLLPQLYDTPEVSTLPLPIVVEEKPARTPPPPRVEVPEPLKTRIDAQWGKLVAGFATQSKDAQEKIYMQLIDQVNAMTEKMPESSAKTLALYLKELAWEEITTLTIEKVSGRFGTANIPFALPEDKYSVLTQNQIFLRGNESGGFDIESRLGTYCIEVYGDDTYAIEIFEKFTKTQALDVHADGSYELDLFADGKMIRTADGKVENTTKYQELTPELIKTIGTDMKKILDGDDFRVAHIKSYLTEK